MDSLYERREEREMIERFIELLLESIGEKTTEGKGCNPMTFDDLEDLLLEVQYRLRDGE